MNIRKAPMFKSVRVPSLPEPGSTRTVTAFHPYCNGMDMLDGALRIFIL